jgi:hypothetical protein
MEKERINQEKPIPSREKEIIAKQKKIKDHIFPTEIVLLSISSLAIKNEKKNIISVKG